VASSADGTKVVAVSNSEDTYTSSDSGATWTASAAINNWSSVASSADGTKLFATDHGGNIYASVFAASTTPGTAGHLIGSPCSSAELQYVGNGQWLVLSYNGTIQAY
jgi:hypothetical protein